MLLVVFNNRTIWHIIQLLWFDIRNGILYKPNNYTRFLGMSSEFRDSVSFLLHCCIIKTLCSSFNFSVGVWNGDCTAENLNFFCTGISLYAEATERKKMSQVSFCWCMLWVSYESRCTTPLTADAFMLKGLTPKPDFNCYNKLILWNFETKSVSRT